MEILLTQWQTKSNSKISGENFHLDTSCKGGDILDFGQIDLSNSIFWDEKEKEI